MPGKLKIYSFICGVMMWCCPCWVTAQQKHPIIAFASDTQAPLFIEKMIRKTDHNEKATELIFKDILTIHPASLFILGDVVSLGYSDEKWQKMDTYLKWCADDSIPVYRDSLQITSRQLKADFSGFSDGLKFIVTDN